MWLAIGMHRDLRGGVYTGAPFTRGELLVADNVVSLSFEYVLDGQVRFGYVVTGVHLDD